jgi:hypothetical protein
MLRYAARFHKKIEEKNSKKFKKKIQKKNFREFFWLFIFRSQFGVCLQKMGGLGPLVWAK